MVGSRSLRSRATSLVLATGLLVAAAGVVCVPASRAVAAPGAGNVAYGWGENDFFEVNGFNSAAYLATPVAAFDGGAGVTQVATGYEGSAVLHADGTVWTWGEPVMLGDGSSSRRALPGKVPGLPTIVQVVTGSYHVLALGADGSVWAWGLDINGELGPNAGPGYSGLPLRVPVPGTVVQLAAGYQFSVALRADGTVWTWGQNYVGQLANGRAEFGDFSATPQRATVPSGIVQVAAGRYHGLALASDGAVYGWGDNTFYQAGRTSPEVSPSVVRIAGLPAITRIAASAGHSMALAADATVWDWGKASNGELGDGRTDLGAEATPVHVPLQGVQQIDGSDGVSMAVLSDGTMWTWGRDTRFAPSTAPDILSPTKVSGVRDVAQFAIDAFTVLVLMAPQPVAVPNLQYSDPVSAGYFLNAVGLNVGPNTPPTSQCWFGDGDVQGQNPAAGTVVQAGTSVDYSFDCVVP